RAMLAMNLSQTEKLPAELARQMAQDAQIEVAGPVLQYSTALTDEDLTSIIGSMVDTSKLQAIARRENVSETVTDMLVSTNIEQVVATLVQNESARISEQTFTEIVQHHKDNNEVLDALFQRSSVPVKVIESVVDNLSQGMRRTLEKKYGDLAEFKSVKKALDASLELTRLKMMGYASSDADLLRLVKQLDKQQRLSPFSALSMGNMQLFEVCLSRILRVPLSNVHTLLQDDTGFKVAYDRAQLPPHLLEATKYAVKALREIEASGKNEEEGQDMELMITRMRSMAPESAQGAVEQLAALLQHRLR
ncbi:MAG: DUF2336 domain-containing protein, partial [Rickettsiales bacterium]|nr:DUF2336 domain-containing protein [Rickettsiales bacterium]